jgi:hypothetical protein
VNSVISLLSRLQSASALLIIDRVTRTPITSTSFGTPFLALVPSSVRGVIPVAGGFDGRSHKRNRTISVRFKCRQRKSFFPQIQSVVPSENENILSVQSTRNR